ncbi:MAG: MMPL family transporter [Candidatus Dormiibacterota bacterium]
MTRITRFALGHRALIVLFWLATAVTGAMTAGLTTSRMTNSFSMPGQAITTDARIISEYGSTAQAPLVTVVTVPRGQRITTPSVAAATASIFDAARVSPGVHVVDYASTHDSAFITSDGRSTFSLTFLPPANYDGSGGLEPVIATAVTSATPAGWHTGFTSITLLQAPVAAKSGGASVLVEAMVGGLGALVILAFVFASFLAFLPLIIGATSVLSTFLLVLGLTTFTGVSMIVEFLIALIGLGVAIDYSLLVVTRWREERAHGRDNVAAVEAAMAHAGRAVVFSGLTVALGLLALIVLPVPMLQSVGYGGVLVPLVSVAVAVTLLPVVLATVGPRLDWPRIRKENGASRMWSAWAHGVYSHRWAAAILGTVILGLIAFPALSLQLGEPASTSLSTTGPARDALTTLTAGGVPSGVLTPIVVLTNGATSETSTLAHEQGVDTAVTTPDAQRAHSALITVLPVAEGSLGAGQDTVRAVRAAIGSNPAVVGVAGDGAQLIDFDNAVYGNFPLMLALIAVATFLLLARAFRSVVLALKAVVFNLVSLAAAYGALTFIWQQGHGSQALWGIPASGAITMWVPLMVFAFLFGLSMDYEVFIIARIREAYDNTGSARAAVIEGVGRTGRLVTSAALILMLTFLSMSSGPQTDIKILATGLGAGILVDAVVVRALMVPAMVALFGRWNWWMPVWLARILRVPAAPMTRSVLPAPQLERAA